MYLKKSKSLILVLFMIFVVFPGIVIAKEAIPTVEGNVHAIAAVQKNLDFVWTLVAAFMVFFMQAGFSMVEAGFTRAKNAVNIMMKNLFDFSIGSIAYFSVGFGLMFGVSKGWIGTSGFFFSDWSVDQDPWLYAFFLFQVVFAATAATIVSGAMAERTKFSSYLVYSFFVSAIIYPIFGSWAWGSLYKGSGWLEGLGFIDFAGSTVVHSVGGWCALAGAIVIGPRKGKFGKDGNVNAIPGHNIPLAAIGVFILWFGWFGFNAGSTTAGITDIAKIAVNTALSGAAGAILALITSWLKFGKADAGMSLNGVLAGLVGITAGCANVSPLSSVIIGAISGVVVVYAVVFFDKLKIDDPVGAVSVHGVCGALGTLFAGVFNETGVTAGLITTQLIGISACFVFVFTASFILFKLIDLTMGLRVTEEEEYEGLDFYEHGANAYPDFVVQSSKH